MVGGGDPQVVACLLPPGRERCSGPVLAQLRTGKGMGGVQVAFAANFAAFIAFAVRGACPLLQQMSTAATRMQSVIYDF